MDRRHIIRRRCSSWSLGTPCYVTGVSHQWFGGSFGPQEISLERTGAFSPADSFVVELASGKRMDLASDIRFVHAFHPSKPVAFADHDQLISLTTGQIVGRLGIPEPEEIASISWQVPRTSL